MLETAEFYAELSSHGVHCGGLLVNRRTPESTGGFLQQRRSSEDAALTLLAEKLPGQPVHTLPWLPHEVSTPEALAALAAELPFGS